MTRREAVALFNTLAKFSEAIKYAREMEQAAKQLEADERASSDANKASGAEQSTATTTSPTTTATTTATTTTSTTSTATTISPSPSNADLINSAHRVDRAIATIRQLALPAPTERALLGAALAREPGLLALTWHYGDAHDLLRDTLSAHAETVASLAKAGSSLQQVQQQQRQDEDEFDVIVIGGGLSGIVCAIRVAERGGRVLLLEKEAFFGGNSAWASSGVNSVLSDDPGPAFDVEGQKFDS